jgi:hypothetical protein
MYWICIAGDEGSEPQEDSSARREAAPAFRIPAVGAFRHAFFGQEMLAQVTGPISFDPLKLPAEIRVVAETYSKPDFQNAAVGFHQQLRRRAHPELVDVGRHRAPGRPFEKPADGGLIHVHVVCEFTEVYLLIKVLVEVLANLIDPPLVFDTAHGADLPDGKLLSLGIPSKVHEHS